MVMLLELKDIEPFWLVDVPVLLGCLGKSIVFTPRLFVNQRYRLLSLVATSIALLKLREKLILQPIHFVPPAVISPVVT